MGLPCVGWFRAQHDAWHVIPFLVGLMLWHHLLVLLVSGLVALFPSLPLGLSSRVFRVLFPFSFFGRLSLGLGRGTVL